MVLFRLENLDVFLKTAGTDGRDVPIGVSHTGYHDCFYYEKEESDGLGSYLICAVSNGVVAGRLSGHIYSPGTEPPFFTDAAAAGFEYIRKNALPIEDNNSDDEGALIRLVTVEDIDIRSSSDEGVRLVSGAVRDLFYDGFLSDLVVWPETAGFTPEGGVKINGFKTGFLSVVPAGFKGDTLIL